MNIRNFSLLCPDDTDGSIQISEQTAHDLAITFVATHAAAHEGEIHILSRILRTMPTDPAVVRYRQAVYRDLRNVPEVCAACYEIFDTMRFYAADAPKGRAGIWELLDYFKMLDNYIRSVSALQRELKDHDFQSEGMQHLRTLINAIDADENFRALSEDIARLGEDISVVRSMTIGVNFDSDLRPAEVGILSLNDYPFTEQGLLEKFLRRHKKQNAALQTTFVTFPHKEGFEQGRGLMMNTLTGIIEELLPELTARLRRILRNYVDTDGMAMTRLADEFLFYVRMIGLEEKMTKAGLPCCIPELSEGETVLKDMYNIRLALCENNIICNDLTFAPHREILILTGPNKGGKTILTQGIGLAFLLFQHGVSVPCREGKIRLCDGIYTHFPADENQTVTLGRLGEEAARLSEICKTATADSLLLFNESFTTTSHSESLYIAEDVLKYLCLLGARTAFNTHMHESLHRQGQREVQ